MREDQIVSLSVNGVKRELVVAADEVLVDTLRDEFGLTSVRGTCGIGTCGTCTVLLDGRIVSGCLTFTWMAEGRHIVTSEGLVGDDGTLSPVQDAFVRAGAYQCSFCIPGMVLAVDACLRERESPSFDEVRQYLAGNLCRCGTYPEILDAVADLLTARAEAGFSRQSSEP